MSRQIKIYDTTLRDGTQGEGVAFSMEDKVRIAHRLDQLCVHYI
jgi:2-isopropylmalate synthase